MILIGLSLLSILAISLVFGNIVAIVAIAFTVIFGYFIGIYVAITLLCMVAVGMLSYKYKLVESCTVLYKKIFN